MGLFFSSSNKKLEMREVWKILHHVPGLNQREREIIYRELYPSRDMGGVSKIEAKDTFRQMRQHRVLETDNINRAEREIMKYL